MQGFQLIFFTMQGEKHGGLSVGEWLLKQSRELGVPGATMNASQAGYGTDGHFHSAHFFELAEQPLEVMMVVTEDECDLLFSRIEAEGIKLLYSKVPVEFGVTGSTDSGN